MQVSFLNKGGLRHFLQKGEALGFVGDRLFLDNILLGGFDGLGFAGNWVFGDWFGWHGKKTSALIEAEATRKNHRHPTGVRLDATLDLETQIRGSEVVTSYTRWLEWFKRGERKNPEVI